MADIYYLSEQMEIGYNAAGKARQDASDILHKKYEEVGFFPDNNGKIFSKIYANLVFCNNLKRKEKIKKNDILIIQFPLPYGFNKILPLLNKMYRCIFLIHDLEGLRYGDDKREKSDIKILQKAYKIIAHNNSMSNYLIKNGVDPKKICEIKLFDYILNSNDYLYSHYCDNALLCFAGNLDKAGFLEILDKEKYADCINVYGLLNKVQFQKLNYCGSYNSNEIVKKIKGKFGLVWDGTAIDQCNGRLGNYLKYNNPYKLSMYICSGIPVVVWKNSALANFVVDNQLGIVTDNIEQALYRIQKITKEEYIIMYENVCKWREKMVEGKMLMEAVSKSLIEE